MNNNILLIVEGKKDEKTIFENVFKKYGFRIERVETKFTIKGIRGEFEKFDFSNEEGTIVVLEAPRNRLHGFLKYINDNCGDIERALNYSKSFFQGIFLIFDVDHNDEIDIITMFEKFNNENDGMLLLSSPCFEVLGDKNQIIKGKKLKHLSEYKKQLNIFHEKNHKCNTLEYIIRKFDNLILEVVERNTQELDSKNVMEHPQLIIDLINKHNERYNSNNEELSYVVYRYFTTVIYVAIAYAHNLTIEIDNVDIVKSFFKKYLN